MAKATYFNPVTGEKREIEIEDSPTTESPIELTLEERVKATEEAIIALMDMGVL